MIFGWLECEWFFSFYLKFHWYCYNNVCIVNFFLNQRATMEPIIKNLLFLTPLSLCPCLSIDYTKQSSVISLCCKCSIERYFKIVYLLIFPQISTLQSSQFGASCAQWDSSLLHYLSVYFIWPWSRLLIFYF